MGSKVTSLKCRRPVAAITLVELLVSVALGSLLMAVVASFLYSSGYSLVALANYFDLGNQNRIAVDTLTRDVRSAREVADWTSNRLELVDFDGSRLSFHYDPAARILTRSSRDQSQVLLRDCDFLSFGLSQRTPMGGAFEVYPAADARTCKVVDVTWHTSRSILGRAAQSDDVQTARIVIRKK